MIKDEELLEKAANATHAYIMACQKNLNRKDLPIATIGAPDAMAHINFGSRGFYYSGIVMIEGVKLEMERNSLKIVGANYPKTTVLAIPGKTLGQIIGLPSCGREDVDKAIKHIAITQSEQMNDGIILSFEIT